MEVKEDISSPLITFLLIFCFFFFLPVTFSALNRLHK